jgi:hypothetical protein
MLPLKHILIALFVLSQLFFVDMAIGQAQNSCEDDLNFITQAYNKGDWSNTKNVSITFINNMQGKDAIILSTRHFKYSDYCKNNISQVYDYLIKSYLRLYNLDSARFYYFEALKNEYKLHIDSTDKEIFSQLATLKKHSVSLYLGIISASYRERQLGLTYGLTQNFFLETFLSNVHFTHTSNIGNGVFGKPLISDPNKFPNYYFRIRGYDRNLGIASYIKIPIFKSQNEVNIFYVSPGIFVSYYLNSYVNYWELSVHESAIDTGRTVFMSNNKFQRYVKIDTFNVKMDLEHLYKPRVNYGLFMNVGSSVNLKNLWQIFFEIKFSVGKNNSYYYSEFSSYKPGVDNFFLVIGITKKFYKLKERKN